jgi:hypothetical protein
MSVISIRPAGVVLICVMPVLALTFAACGDIKINPGDPDDVRCRQLRERSADTTLTQARVAEIKKDMEGAGCGSLLP